MNFLAHIYLARHSDDAMLGALLGDFVKPSTQALYLPQIEQEIILHRKIDSYTDSHPITLEARSLFDAKRRRYAGILLDVFYDHVLAKKWRDYSDEPLAKFIENFYGVLRQAHTILPENLAYAAPRMMQQDWLGSYLEFDGVRIAIQRMSHRLSRNGDVMCEGLLDLELHYDVLSTGFTHFFPDLIRHAEEQRAKLAQSSSRLHEEFDLLKK